MSRPVRPIRRIVVLALLTWLLLSAVAYLVLAVVTALGIHEGNWKSWFGEAVGLGLIGLGVGLGARLGEGLRKPRR